MFPRQRQLKAAGVDIAKECLQFFVFEPAVDTDGFKIRLYEFRDVARHGIGRPTRL